MKDPDYNRARVAVSVVFFINGCVLGSWVPHLATLKQRFSASAGELGLALLAGALGAVLTMPFAGIGIHRFGSRVVSLLGGLALCAVLPFLISSPTLPIFVALLFTVGVLNGQMDVAMNAHSVAVQKAFNRPIISAIHGWFSLGGFAGGASAAAFSALSLSPAIHLTSVCAAMAGLLCVASTKMLPSASETEDEGARFVLPRGRLFPLALLALLAFMSEGALFDWAAIYVRTTLESSEAMGGLAFACFSIGMAAGRFVGDALIHRFNARNVFVASALAIGAGLLLGVSFGTVLLALVGFTIAGIAMANIIPIIFTAAGTVPGVRAGAGLAAVTTFGYSAAFLGPPAVGFIADARSLGFALGLMALLCLVVAAVGWRWIEPHVNELEAEPLLGTPGT